MKPRTYRTQPSRATPVGLILVASLSWFSPASPAAGAGLPATMVATESVAVADPSVIGAGERTAVTVTISINDPKVIPGTVALERLDARGRVIAVLGLLNDLGFRGDATRRDHIFSIRRSFREVTSAPIQLQVSWVLRSPLRLAVSRVNVDVGQRITNGLDGYSTVVPIDWNGEPSSEPTVFLLRPANKAPNPTTQYSADIVVRVRENVDDLSLADFYSATPENWFRESITQAPLLVDGNDAIRFEHTYGVDPNVITAIRRPGTVVEIIDVGEKHQDDGIYDAVVSGFRFAN